MRKFDTPCMADWFAISLRWIVLAGVMILLAWTGGGLHTPSFPAGLLPILTGSIYFEGYGGMLVAVLFSSVILLLGLQAEGGLVLAAYASGALIFFGLSFGARRSMAKMRENRNLSIEKGKKKRAIQSERLQAICQLTSTFSAILSYQRVLDSALDMSAAALPPDPSPSSNDPLVGAVTLFSSGRLWIGSASRLTSADMRVAFDAAEGVLKKALDQGESLAFKDMGDDRQLGRLITLRNCASGYCFPLHSGFNVYGVLLFAHPNVEHFNPQTIAAMALRLNITRRMLARELGAAAREIIKLEEMAHRTTKEIRHRLFTLRPLILESQGWTAAIQAMADKMLATFSQKVVVPIDEKITSQLEMGKQGVIFSLVEEAVNNARKHASAETITGPLCQVDIEIALLEIADNGVGFDVKAMSQLYDQRANSSLGRINLRERAELVNGLPQIDLKVGKGTKIQVFIPHTQNGADRLRQPCQTAG